MITRQLTTQSCLATQISHIIHRR